VLSVWLQVQDLSHAFPRKDVMVSPDSLAETKMPQKMTQSVEWNRGIRSSPQDPLEQKIAPRHRAVLAKPQHRAQ